MNSKFKIFITDSNGDTREFKCGEIPTFTGADFATCPDRTGCAYVNPKSQISGTLLFDKKTTDLLKLAFAERNLKALQSWIYYKARPSRVRRRIKSLKRKIKAIKRKYWGDAEWLANLDDFRNLI